jgi:hypothetical protein
MDFTSIATTASTTDPVAEAAEVLMCEILAHLKAVSHDGSPDKLSDVLLVPALEELRQLAESLRRDGIIGTVGQSIASGRPILALGAGSPVPTPAPTPTPVPTPPSRGYDSERVLDIVEAIANAFGFPPERMAAIIESTYGALAALADDLRRKRAAAVSNVINGSFDPVIAADGAYQPIDADAAIRRERDAAQAAQATAERRADTAEAARATAEAERDAALKALQSIANATKEVSVTGTVGKRHVIDTDSLISEAKAVLSIG